MPETETSQGSAPAAEGEEPEEDMDFDLPDIEFDEDEWRRDEIASAYMSFLTFGYGLLLGAAARGLETVAPDWKAGWIPIVGGVFTLKIVLTKAGYGEQLDDWKSVAGNAFLLFFTGFAVWVLLSNPPFA